ncbi:MAG: imidazoleglycerol-phosphate dehydratase [Actinomycetota bacterium]|jgi:imidazoleglycerol-phosphate dehydratase|nr:imidazoleglycerol-phosphate dehydratase [Actinomycetota bacterium]
MTRRGRVERKTSETEVIVEVGLDESGRVSSATGVPFFDHMLDQLGRHGRFDLLVEATGDLEIDAHHTVEDVGIALGEALTKALGDKKGIRRYGDALVPMEEALARVALDISGRPLLVYGADVGVEPIGQYDPGLTEEFLQALCRSGGLTLHVDLIRSRNPHHGVEAIFKALAVALGEAVSIDPRAPDQVPSTKGTL